MLRAVVFDLDDTLVDQATASRAAVLAWAAELGISDPAVPDRWARISARHYARYQRRDVTFAGQRRDRVREFLAGDGLPDAEADRLFAGYLERYEAGWALFGDALPALRRVRAAGLTVAVLTNGEESQQRRKVERLGLDGALDLLVASSSLPAGKPDLRAFRYCADRLGVAAAEAMMVGDSLDKDVLAARAAGMHAVLLDRYDVYPGFDGMRLRSLDDLDLPV